ncbi:hypothetical protein PAHAL_5G350000 [Panicum hallii]|jgi:hypothetical protein|uniref:Uncharacterized protein n=1 Tax=Panicum hallii TaxID=206008 RepID=A0A2T8IM67_9POAL|nr:hypothetical protein PAHAL_5G350000 [Panicum hallii]
MQYCWPPACALYATAVAETDRAKIKGGKERRSLQMAKETGGHAHARRRPTRCPLEMRLGIWNAADLICDSTEARYGSLVFPTRRSGLRRT